jgi:HEAT repeat protein
LGGISSSAALPALTRLFNKGDVAIRREVVLAFGQIGSKSALRLLGAALDDAAFEVRLNAARAIADALKQDDVRPDEKDFRENEPSRRRDLKARLVARGIELP